MKKLLAFVLAFTLVLSMSAVAFAAGSPTGGGGDSSYFAPPPAPAPNAPKAQFKGGKIVPNAGDEQKAAIDKAIAEVTELGYLPVEAFFVEKDADAADEASLADGDVVFVFDTDGNYTQFDAKDFELSVSGDCVVVIAKEK